MPNRLAGETSPYLRQHMNNPVDWYPWGDEALERARALDRPILLSVGYAACHWCHVMEHESFENAEVAALMNERFVSIKVDREERPDLDHIYMSACHLFTGSGGWPLTVFLTPSLQPFFAGTYFPREDRYGRPGFKRVLGALSDAWNRDRADVTEQATRFESALASLAEPLPAGPSAPPPGPNTLPRAAVSALRRFDAENGGFGHAPKFPNTLDLLLLEGAARSGHEPAGAASLQTCMAMINGGIHDQLGGGFHRYSTDERWLVPHFEKMAYDNALIPRVLLAAWRRTGKPELRTATEGVFAYLQREMTAPGGAFFATQDADSEGKEGTFFCWTPAQVEAAVSDPMLARAACLRFGVTAEGNFEIEDHASGPGRAAHGERTNVLHRARTVEGVARELGLPTADLERMLADATTRMFTAREQRVKPARDEKILAGWNGLVASAFFDAAATLGDAGLRDRGAAALRFVMTQMRTSDGGLYRVHAGGAARIPGLLEDYAFMARALCDAHRAGAGATFLRDAVELCEQLLTRFHDSAVPGFFATEAGAPHLLVRARSNHDDAVPAGASLAVQALGYVGTVTGNRRFVDVADAVIHAHAGEMDRRPTSVASLVLAAHTAARGYPTVVISGPGDDLRAEVRRVVDADVIVVDADAESGLADGELLRGKDASGGVATAYVCAGNTCQPPATTRAALQVALRAGGLWNGVPGPG